MTLEDVCNTLMQQNMIYIREPTPPIIRPSPGQSIKFPKGRKNGVGRRQLQRLQSSHTPTYDGSSHSPTPKTNGHSNEHEKNKGPFVAPKHYEIRFEREKVEAYLRKWESKGYMRLKPEKLQWTPYLVTRSTGEAPKVDLPAMDTVAVDTPATESVVVVSEPPTEPVTPAPMRNGEEMLVDTVEEPRARTRSSARSCSSPGQSVRTRSSQAAPVEEAMSTRSGRLLTELRPPRSKKRRRIESSPEEEAAAAVVAVNGDGVVKWEDNETLPLELDEDADADGEYDLDAEGEPDTEFVM